MLNSVFRATLILQCVPELRKRRFFPNCQAGIENLIGLIGAVPEQIHKEEQFILIFVPFYGLTTRI